MKTFFKVIGYIVLTVLIAAYLAFLFILPKKVDLNIYKEFAQKLVEEQAHLNLDFENIQIVTTPILETGVKINGLTVTLPDGSNLFTADSIKTKVSLPNLLLFTVRVSEVAVENPNVNIEIEPDGSQYKVMRLVENLINEQKQKQETTPSETSNFPVQLIKIKVPNVKAANYNVLINDLQSKHTLTLKGDELLAAYNNMKTFKVKTYAQLLSDDNVNINANIDIDSFIPPSKELDEDDDPDYRAVLDFVNPVLLYRDYDLKTDVNAKIKARQKRNGHIAIKGFANVEGLTMNLSGYQLPRSYFRAGFKGDTVDLNTNLYVAKNQDMQISGRINYSAHPKMDLNINTKRIYFNDLIILTKAFMDTLHIKNDLGALKSSGYFCANAKIKTNFKKLNSNGGIIVRNGNISNNSTGLLFKDANANILFKGKVLEIEDTHLFINDSILKAEGKIDENSIADISLYAEKLPLPGLFAAFAPVDAKKTYDINSGSLLLDVKVTGKLKEAISNVKAVLSNLDLTTKDKSLRITDENMQALFASNFKTVTGNVKNENLNVYLTPTNSIISNPKLDVLIDEENINISPIAVKINQSSKITFKGLITDYMKKKALIDLSADGNLYADDLKQILGDAAAPFINAKGVLPLKFVLNGTTKRQDMICQIKSDKLNYITPVDIDSVEGQQSIIQAKISFKGDRLNIKDTGLFAKTTPTLFTDDLTANMAETKEVAVVSGTITKLDTPKPFINQIKVTIPDNLKMQICAFKNSVLSLGGKLLIFGQASSPKYRGEFSVWDLSIPELLTSMKNLNLKFVSKTLHITLEDLLLNGSDIQVTGNASLEPAPVFTVNNLDIKSSNIDVEKLMKVNDAAMKYVPASTDSSNSETADIPVVLKGGSIDMKSISAPPILLNNTTGKISLNNNIFYLNYLNTTTLDATVTGDVSANLITMLLKAKVQGVNFDVERTFLELMGMKDTLSGTMSFDTDLEINGAAANEQEQMKGINGDVNFVITNGQLGPFGRLENLILAENIRESQFFQTALGGIINSLTSIQTSHFNILTGHIEMADGVAVLDPITSIGPVMCMHIAGDMNLLTSEADMKLRARLGSQIADMLGPLAAINPINLVKATPGLNVATAKMFSIFCEQLTQEEMDAIPNFEEGFGVMSTTNFQVVIRGDTNKPLSLIKSFKWLATAAQMSAAEQFVDTLPEADAENPDATLEELLAAQEEAEKIANENIFQKGIRKVKDFFSRFKKAKPTEETTEE